MGTKSSQSLKELLPCRTNADVSTVVANLPTIRLILAWWKTCSVAQVLLGSGALVSDLNTVPPARGSILQGVEPVG